MDDDHVPAPAAHREHREITIAVGTDEIAIYETGNPDTKIVVDELVEVPQ